MNRYLSLVALMLLLAAPCLLQECPAEVPEPKNDDLRESLETCIKRIDSLEKSFTRVDQLEATVKALRTQIDNPPEMTSMWHFMGLYHFTGSVQGFSIPVSAVPETAREALVFMNIDTSGPGAPLIQGNVWTQRKDKKFNYFYSSNRNFAPYRTTNSMYWWFPIRNTDRTLYVMSTTFSQDPSSHANVIGLGIVAYR